MKPEAWFFIGVLTASGFWMGLLFWLLDRLESCRREDLKLRRRYASYANAIRRPDDVA